MTRTAAWRDSLVKDQRAIRGICNVKPIKVKVYMYLYLFDKWSHDRFLARTVRLLYLDYISGTSHDQNLISTRLEL